jgi:hypothetical protein
MDNFSSLLRTQAVEHVKREERYSKTFVKEEGGEDGARCVLLAEEWRDGSEKG